MTGCTHGLLVDIARFTLLREDLYVWYSPFNPGELLISCWRMNALRSLKTVNYGIRLNSNYRGARARTSSHGFDLLFHRLFDPHQKGSQQNTTWRIDCVHIDWCGFTLFIHNQHGCLNSNDKMCQTKLCTTAHWCVVQKAENPFSCSAPARLSTVEINLLKFHL